MMDHSANTLRAAIKCLRDTVQPAIDPADPQANEQLRLTIDFLEFLRTRLYDVHARHRYELSHQIEVARALLPEARLISPRAAAELESALAGAALAYQDVEGHTDELRNASLLLWARVRGVIRAAREASAEVRKRVACAVLSGVGPLVEMESAWYLPFGFEPDPATVPPLETLVRRAPGMPS
jgi:hypothetical protein